MKTILILLIALSVSALADKSKLQTKLTSLLNMQARAVDAVESALQVLRDLKQENIDAQAASDEINRTQERDLGKQIADLTFIADTNKATGDEATANRKHIQEEIQSTNERLVWINKRREEIHRKRAAFQEHRCYSSLMFVKGLKEHDEALKVIRWLKEDVVGIVQGSGSSLAEIKDSYNRLKQYAHLFNENALKEFAQLTEQQAQAVDPSTAEWNTAADDNDKSALSLNRMGSGADERDVGNKLIQAIEKLEQHLVNSMEDLKKSEIASAWNLVKWLQETEKELVNLDEEQATKTQYMDRLLIAIVGAKAYEDRVWEIYFESAKTLNDAIDDLNKKREYYAQEKARREEENALLDEIIRMFIERVSTLDANMKNKVNTGADIARSADAAYEKDYGRVGSNVESESWA